jgi:hypothetical protein
MATGLMNVSTATPFHPKFNLPAAAIVLVEGLELNLDTVDTVDAVDEKDQDENEGNLPSC